METFYLGDVIINGQQATNVILTIGRIWQVGDRCTAISDTMQCTGYITKIDPNGDMWLNTIRFPKEFCTFIR